MTRTPNEDTYRLRIENATEFTFVMQTLANHTAAGEDSKLFKYGVVEESSVCAFSQAGIPDSPGDMAAFCAGTPRRSPFV